MVKYLLENKLLSDRQCGFIPGKSTHQAIFKTLQDVYNNLNNKKLPGMLLLDVAKAFNCINHDIL